MVQPNAAAAVFCNWCQTSSFWRWTPARANLIEIIKQAALNTTPVTMQQWNDFIRITNPVYLAFLQYGDLST
jgi:hypothetical protein